MNQGMSSSHQSAWNSTTGAPPTSYASLTAPPSAAAGGASADNWNYFINVKAVTPFPAGMLWRAVIAESNFHASSLETNKEFLFYRTELKPIDQSFISYLLPMQYDRRILGRPEQLDIAARCKVGCIVLAADPFVSSNAFQECTIRYIGPIGNTRSANWQSQFVATYFILASRTRRQLRSQQLLIGAEGNICSNLSDKQLLQLVVNYSPAADDDKQFILCTADWIQSFVDERASPSIPAIQLLQQHNLDYDMAVISAHDTKVKGILRWCGYSTCGVPLAGIDCHDHDSLMNIVPRHQVQDASLPPGNLTFVQLSLVQVDPDFMEQQHYNDGVDASTAAAIAAVAADDAVVSPSAQFGRVQCDPVPGDHPPVCADHYGKLIGRERGVQGHHNSCYLDVTLFAMFTASSAFDSVLVRRKRKGDIPEFEQIQACLKTEIVNCLRHHKFVRADHVIKFRALLDRLGQVPGMESEEKDPEEFMNLLLDYTLKHDGFIKLSTGQSSHVYQLIIDQWNASFSQADTETLLHLSCIQSGLKLQQVPACLILQMPRSGRDYKLFDRIIPTPEIDISHLLTDHPQQCAMCGHLATIECHTCFLKHAFDHVGQYCLCDDCHKAFKEHKAKGDGAHKFKKIESRNYKQIQNHYKKTQDIPHVKLQLSAVICIHTSHYVCFLRMHNHRDSKLQHQLNSSDAAGKQQQRQQQQQHPQWLFFDSMADRVGLQTGYNVPEVKDLADVDYYLMDLLSAARQSLSNHGKQQQHQQQHQHQQDQQLFNQLPEHVKRLLTDCYFCFYESEDAQMYK